jgi:adenylosuccinate lyase
MEIPNILAERYASPAMKNIWSPAGKIRLERELWIAVLRAQRELGLPIEESVIQDHEAVVDTIDLDSIKARELVTRHDVKARIEEFNALAGHEVIHRGMTSRDLTENVEQLQVLRSLELIEKKAAALLLRFGREAKRWKDLVVVGRSHNVPAQPTTLGKRLANWGEELQLALDAFRHFRETYPLRGMKGAVGTQLDPITLLGGSEQAAVLDDKIRQHLGFSGTFTNVGQVYPRSLDQGLVSLYARLAAAPTNFSRALRLMAGHDLMHEGFAPGQTGSSAMPHKVNSRSCERIEGFSTLLHGYLVMADQLSGGQWLEGDVSCSVVRRVLLPDASFAIDGILETGLTILDQWEIFPGRIQEELEQHLPFLASTTVLMKAVGNGVGREQAHAAVKEHALKASRDLREGKAGKNPLAHLWASDPRLKLSHSEIDKILEETRHGLGRASEQIESWLTSLEVWAERHPEALSFEPEALL